MKSNIPQLFAVPLSVFTVFGFACGSNDAVVGGRTAAQANVEAPVTWVDHSKVERQSIGNCWIYATTGWAESLNKATTGVELNLSQSYITYWHWFDQIVNRRTGEIETGGSFDVAINLFDRYGLMKQGDFIPEEAEAEMSARQASALSAINDSLARGVLSDSTKRGDRATVRAELDRAWALDESSVQLLDAVFGADVNTNLERGYVDVAPPTGARDGVQLVLFRPVDIPVRAVDSSGWIQASLRDVMGQKSGWSRSGPLAWQSIDYPTYPAADRRELQIRVQRALHDHQPVVMSWFVDFNALGRDGSFTLEQLNNQPGRQGGHMVVMYDYEVTNVPGFGTLPAGVEETRPEALEAALSPDAEVKFFRVKNSWGSYRPDRGENVLLPGYHDLYVTYLNGPIKQCDSSNTSDCRWDIQPWWDVVLPAGY